MAVDYPIEEDRAYSIIHFNPKLILKVPVFQISDHGPTADRWVLHISARELREVWQGVLSFWQMVLTLPKNRFIFTGEVLAGVHYKPEGGL